MTATQTPSTNTIPGYLEGTWVIDPVHSEVSFTVRHLMLSKVRGRFGQFSGELVTAGDPFQSSVQASVDLASIDTGNSDRDAHVRSADFFDVEQYPTLTYRSTGVRVDGDGFVVDGDLTLHGVTKSVPLTLEVNGFQPETPFGDTRVGFSANAEINRNDFGIEFNTPLDGGGVGLGNKVQIALEIQAIRQA
jgi:polyisoprenoid-binding protein YceI